MTAAEFPERHYWLRSCVAAAGGRFEHSV